jgi:hypothetical protein
MIEILQTNFDSPNNEIRVSPDISAGAPYTIFEPVVEQETGEGVVEKLDAQKILDQMLKYADAIELEPPYTVPLGSGEKFTVDDILSGGVDAFLSEINQTAEAPKSLSGILMTIAGVAQASGFNPETSDFGASFLYPRGGENVNRVMHSDGLSGVVDHNTQSAKVVRFVYALGPGSIIFPSLQPGDGEFIQEAETPGQAKVLSNIDPIRALNSARKVEANSDEQIEGSSQQVMPGRVLGFDPTRTFWHQAPVDERPILVVDISQVEKAHS